MTTFQIVGLVIFIGGMVPYAIGSLIHIAHHPNALELLFRMVPWPSWRYGWPGLTHPKARWLYGIGFPICIAGFVIIAVSTVPDIAIFAGLFAAFFSLRRIQANRR